jgi:hypothetical protein
MQRNVKRSWMFSTVLAFGLAAGSALAADSEKTIKYRDLPEPVKKVVDEQRGKDDVKMITAVNRDGHEFYRVTINSKGADKVLRVDPGGKILDEKAVADRGPEREAAPRDVKGGGGGVESANFDNFPGKVKETTMREAKSYVKVVGAWKYNHNGTEFYKTRVSDGNRERLLIVKGDGSLYSDIDDTDAGKGEVNFDKVPSAPRTAIGREAGPNKVSHVYQISRNSATYYRVMLDNRHEFVVTDDGKIDPAFASNAAPDSRKKR